MTRARDLDRAIRTWLALHLTQEGALDDQEEVHLWVFEAGRKKYHVWVAADVVRQFSIGEIMAELETQDAMKHLKRTRRIFLRSADGRLLVDPNQHPTVF